METLTGLDHFKQFQDIDIKKQRDKQLLTEANQLVTHSILSDEKSLRVQRLIELRDALIIKGRIEEDENTSLKYLLKDVIAYKDFTPLVRNDIVKLITYEVYSLNEVIVTPMTQSSVEMYVIINGSVKLSAFPPDQMDKELTHRDQFDLLSQLEIFKTLGPGDCFGDFSHFQGTEKSWKDLMSINSQFQKQNYCTERKNFTIIHLSKGKKSEYAFIVIKGELKMISEKIPIIINNIDKIKRAKQRTVVNNNGYFSQTLNSFQIGIVSSLQWAGDEVIVLREDPFPYSVIASSVVEVLQISKNDLLMRVSKDIRELMEQKVTMKLEWIKTRLIEICIGVENVALFDNLQQDFIDKVNECTKKYPATNFGAFVKIVNQKASIKPTLEAFTDDALVEAVVEDKAPKVQVIQSRKTLVMAPDQYSRPKSAEHFAHKRRKSEIYQGGVFLNTVDFKTMVDKQINWQQNPLRPSVIIRSSTPLDNSNRLLKKNDGSQTTRRPETSASTQCLTKSASSFNLSQRSGSFLKFNMTAQSQKSKDQVNMTTDFKHQKITNNKIPLDNASTFLHSFRGSNTYSVPTISKACLSTRKTQLLLALKMNQIPIINKYAKDDRVQAQLKQEVSNTHKLFQVCGRQIEALPFAGICYTRNQAGQSVATEKFKQKVPSDQAYFATRRIDCNDDLVKGLLSTTPKEYCNILQHPYYYQSLCDLQTSENTLDTHQQQATIKIEENNSEGMSMRQELISLEQASTNDAVMNDEDSDLEDVYIEMFGNHKIKYTRYGRKYQATSIPLVTDISYFEALGDMEALSQQGCSIQWDSTRLTHADVDYYLANIQLLWPYQLYHYQEEPALYFLHLKNYDIPLALSTVLYNQDQLVKLLLAIRKKRRAQGLLTNILIKQNQKAQITRQLRDRRQPYNEYDEMDLFQKHQQQKLEELE